MKFFFPTLWILAYGLFLFQMWTNGLTIWGLIFVTFLVVKEMLEEVNKMLEARIEYWRTQSEM